MSEYQSKGESISDLLNQHVLHLVRKIVFPFSSKQPLNGSEVGYIAFIDPNSRSLWQIDKIKETLMKIAATPIDSINLDELYQTCTSSASSEWRPLVDAILLLDQGARYLCRGINGRYIYQFFDLLTLYVVNRLISEESECFKLQSWEDKSKMSADHAVLRIMMLLAPLAHSEDITDQRMLLSMTENLRKAYETAMGESDPHRATYGQDLTDISLLNGLLLAGPPQGTNVSVSDYVFWMMRYYTSHYAYHAHFGRSPFRNVAVGRRDTPAEAVWLKQCGVAFTPDSEEVRRRIREDIDAHRWTKLEIP